MVITSLVYVGNDPKKQALRTSHGKTLKGMGAVVDMAALSNDPAGELNPKKPIEINSRGTWQTCPISKRGALQELLVGGSMCWPIR